MLMVHIKKKVWIIVHALTVSFPLNLSGWRVLNYWKKKVFSFLLLSTYLPPLFPLPSHLCSSQQPSILLSLQKSLQNANPNTARFVPLLLFRAYYFLSHLLVPNSMPFLIHFTFICPCFGPNRREEWREREERKRKEERLREEKRRQEREREERRRREERLREERRRQEREREEKRRREERLREERRRQEREREKRRRRWWDGDKDKIVAEILTILYVFL